MAEVPASDIRLITGSSKDLLYLRKIASGGFGEVHEVCSFDALLIAPKILNTNTQQVQYILSLLFRHAPGFLSFWLRTKS